MTDEATNDSESAGPPDTSPESTQTGPMQGPADTPVPSSESTEMGPTPEPVEKPASGRSRTVVILGVAVVVLLVVVAGLIGYLVGTEHPDEVATPTIPAVPGTKSLTLRETVNRMNADLHAAQPRGEYAMWDAMKRYAEPACASVLEGFAAAFGGGNESTTTGPSRADDPSEIVSVTENGDRGTVVSRAADTGKNETMHWARRESVWRFTCEGIFDQETSSSVTTGAPKVGSGTPDRTVEPNTEGQVPPTTTEVPSPRTTTVPNEDPNLDQSAWDECVRQHSNAECRELLGTNQR